MTLLRPISRHGWPGHSDHLPLCLPGLSSHFILVFKNLAISCYIPVEFNLSPLLQSSLISSSCLSHSV